jgi:GH18 family chitinase
MSRPVIGANYAGWNSANYPVSAIPADGITHLFYAFATIENGEYVVDRRNMTLLSQEFRRRLDQRDRRVKLSAALPAGRLQTDGPYDPAVSFENPASIGIRAEYAARSGLRGTFMWELSDDDAEHSLLAAMSAPFVR